MKIQSVKGVLLAITASMVASLVLMPQVAFSQVSISTAGSCTFLETNGSTTVTVEPVDRVKVASQGKGGGGTLNGMCKDDSLTTNDRLVFVGSDCTVYASQGIAGGLSFKQVIDKNGVTLTCHGEEDKSTGPPPCRDHRACGD